MADCDLNLIIYLVVLIFIFKFFFYENYAKVILPKSKTDWGVLNDITPTYLNNKERLTAIYPNILKKLGPY